MQNLDGPLRDEDIFNNLAFFNSTDASIENNRFFLQFLVDILPLFPGS